MIQQQRLQAAAATAENCCCIHCWDKRAAARNDLGGALLGATTDVAATAVRPDCLHQDKGGRSPCRQDSFVYTEIADAATAVRPAGIGTKGLVSF